ncbi:MAG: glucose 1-dehydrogenase [Deltaproteobacteria bacterium]|nr:glucose 1-dehydrogenase [Deltaproteobacteria bacterium]
MQTLPDALRPGGTSVIRLRVTDDMVRKFSELTGDRSPLHVESEFARRSIYRGEVVHGMLTVAFIGALDMLDAANRNCRLTSLNAQFTSPVYAGDTFVLTGVVITVDHAASSASIEYTVENTRTRIVVCKGEAVVNYRGGANDAATQTAGRPFSLPDEPLEPMDVRFERISKGDPDSILFSIKDGSIAALKSILSEGIEGALESSTGFLSDLLCVLLFSTSAGMRIPGRRATFLEFTASVRGEIRLDTAYKLNGMVSHVSRAGRIIKKTVSITVGGTDASLLDGKVAVIVNPDHAKMPDMRQLKDDAMDLGIKGKVVVVTGASRGIGETTARLFALHGAKVAVNYFRGETDAKRIVDDITSSGGEALAIGADVSDAGQVREMIRKTVERFSRVDILVNNAVRDFKPTPFLKLDWDDLQKDMDVTLKGAFNCCKEVIPLMLSSGGGRIINVSTIAVETPPPNQSKYVCSKSALVGLTRSLAVEFASNNIQVNCVVPNFVETDLVGHIPEVYRKKIADDTPLRRNSTATDVAKAVIFLASSYSSFTTGQKVMVTGGAPPYL